MLPTESAFTSKFKEMRVNDSGSWNSLNIRLANQCLSNKKTTRLLLPCDNPGKQEKTSELQPIEDFCNYKDNFKLEKQFSGFPSYPTAGQGDEDVFRNIFGPGLPDFRKTFKGLRESRKITACSNDAVPSVPIGFNGLFTKDATSSSEKDLPTKNEILEKIGINFKDSDKIDGALESELKMMQTEPREPAANSDESFWQRYNELPKRSALSNVFLSEHDTFWARDIPQKNPARLRQILSREDCVNDKAIPMYDKEYYEEQAKRKNKAEYSYLHPKCKSHRTIHDLPEGIMIKIFSYLKIPVLTKISRTCKTWHRLSLDMDLWTVVDLTPFRYQMNDYKIVQIIKTFLVGSIRKLSLAEFSISAQILRELAKCETLRSLNLDSCTFVGKFQDNCLTKSFPADLTSLSMRHTSGAASVMNVVRPRLVSVRQFYASNKVIDCCDIEELITSLCSIQLLKISNSIKIDHRAMKLMARHCNNLRCLSLKHCSNFTGEGLKELVKECPGLEQITFNGTELKDKFVTCVKWRNTAIRRLEVSWCRNLSDKGLRSMICDLEDLVYLKVSSCGNGRALNNALMHFIASSTSLSLLQEIDFSFGRDLTNEGLLALTCLPSLKYLSLSNCSQLTPEVLSEVDKKSNMFITVTFSSESSDQFPSFGRTHFRRTGGRSYF